MTKRYTIDPITRLEGHGRIEVFLDDAGEVEQAYLQVPEFRGFEQFCVGRPVAELPRITPRICGVCPEAHHLASAKACDAVYGLEPPPAGKKLRELFYCAHMIHSHIAHFYALAAPDFVLGPDADPALRNVLGVVDKVGLEIGGEVIKHRSLAQKVQEMLGGKATHPVCGIPGGMSIPMTEEMRTEVEAIGESCVTFSEFSLQLFKDVVLGNKAYVDLILSDGFKMDSYYMGLVDDNNKVNFYDGHLRVVDPEGKEFARFHPSKYLDYIQEHVEPWTYLKFPHLKDVGWKGMVTGKDSGVYRVAPLGRLNASDGMATPKAQAAYDGMYEVLGGKPSHHTLAMHWARLVELLYASERMLELAKDPEITSENVRTVPTATPTEGVGVVEAPRGTLIHHYWSDPEGRATALNLIVATGNNYAAMNISVDQAAKAVIHNGEVDQGKLNMVEMAFRAYDPCLACATHAVTGETPLPIELHRKGQDPETVSTPSVVDGTTHAKAVCFPAASFLLNGAK